jgi:hypothetical protein
MVLFLTKLTLLRAHGSVVGLGTLLQAGRSLIKFLIRSLEVSVYVILPTTL